jgi:hypothetical protein
MVYDWYPNPVRSGMIFLGLEDNEKKIEEKFRG